MLNNKYEINFNTEELLLKSYNFHEILTLNAVRLFFDLLNLNNTKINRIVFININKCENIYDHVVLQSPFF